MCSICSHPLHGFLFQMFNILLLLSSTYFFCRTSKPHHPLWFLLSLSSASPLSSTHPIWVFCAAHLMAWQDGEYKSAWRWAVMCSVSFFSAHFHLSLFSFEGALNKSLIAKVTYYTIREGIRKKHVFLGQSPKQRTPSTHPYSKKWSKIHEQIICLEWSNMPYKHDIVFFTKKFRTLDPHPHSWGLCPKTGSQS